jgi:hypothetical protein
VLKSVSRRKVPEECGKRKAERGTKHPGMFASSKFENSYGKSNHPPFP